MQSGQSHRQGSVSSHVDSEGCRQCVEGAINGGMQCFVDVTDLPPVEIAAALGGTTYFVLRLHPIHGSIRRADDVHSRPHRDFRLRERANQALSKMLLPVLLRDLLTFTNVLTPHIIVSSLILGSEIKSGVP
jgi:hypothetical protein